MSVDEVARQINEVKTDRLLRFTPIIIGLGARPAAYIELEGNQIDLIDGTIPLLY